MTSPLGAVPRWVRTRSPRAVVTSSRSTGDFDSASLSSASPKTAPKACVYSGTEHRRVGGVVPEILVPEFRKVGYSLHSGDRAMAPISCGADFGVGNVRGEALAQRA